MSNWYMYKSILTVANGERETNAIGYGNALLPEFTRLHSQRCIACSGYGHSIKDCPTNAKLNHLRGGVREQNQLLKRALDYSRSKHPMCNVAAFSLLRVKNEFQEHESASDFKRDTLISLNNVKYRKQKKP